MSVCGIGKNAAVIPNPVDLEKFDKKSGEGKLQSASGKKMVLFAGRFSYEKGISNMMEFISKVSSEKNDVEFVLAGSGPLLGFAENFVKKKKLGNVFFAGNLPYEKLIGLYKACDLVVFPSVWQEPFGRVAAEAMAAGKPVVASNVGGIVETVQDNKTGFLVEPNDINAWAKKIAFLLDNEKTAKEFGKRGRKIAEERFAKGVIADQIISVYREAL